MFFYTTLRSDSTIIRKIEITDNTLPASNAIMARVLYALGIYFENDNYLDKSRQMVSRVYPQLRGEKANYYATWCFLAGLFAYGTNEVAIVGKDALNKNVELQKNYLPVALFLDPTERKIFRC